MATHLKLYLQITLLLFTSCNTVDIDKKTGTKDQMVLIQTTTGKTAKSFKIDAFEASYHRAFPGISRSVPGATPLTKISYIDAGEACDSAGKRLCTLTEWQTACKGTQGNKSGVVNPSLLRTLCDVARSDGSRHEGKASPTGSYPECTPAGNRIFDLIGNVAEFVSHPDGPTVVGLTYYDSHRRDLESLFSSACEVIVAKPGEFSTDRYAEGLGFRCCKDE